MDYMFREWRKFLVSLIHELTAGSSLRGMNVETAAAAGAGEYYIMLIGWPWKLHVYNIDCKNIIMRQPISVLLALQYRLFSTVHTTSDNIRTHYFIRCCLLLLSNSLAI